MVPHVLGDFWQLLLQTTSWRSVIDQGQLVVAFGGMPWSNGQINAGGIGRHVQREHMIEARDAGIEFVNVGPIRVDIDDSLNAEWLAVRPGTDTAVLIAFAKTLVPDFHAYLQVFDFFSIHCRLLITHAIDLFQDQFGCKGVSFPCPMKVLLKKQFPFAGIPFEIGKKVQ